MYQLKVKSDKPFTTGLEGFKIILLDKDGFKVKEIIVKEFSHAVDVEGTVFGISANSNSYLSIKDYARIGKWDLLVTTK